MSKGKIIVGLSGGVDSAVAALLLKREGYEVIGLFMKNWEGDDTDEYCSSRQDLVDAAAAADVIGIEFEAVNFSEEYRERVFADFLREYQAGRTPNPDVLCNSEIKFKAFLDHAMALGADKIATGHYAQVREFLGEWQLLKAEDGTKDQSYFLHRLNQAQLAKTLFPVGHLYKRDVRRIAEEAGLPNHARKDSTGICFIGERPFREFLARYLPKQPGEIRVLGTDRVVGRHDGMMYYTLGQREGLGIGGVKGAPEEPWFVASKDMEKKISDIANEGFFWDVDANSLDEKTHWFFIIERLLKFGSEKEIRLILQHFSEVQLREVIKKSRNLDRKTANYWAIHFGIEKKDVRCLTMPLIQACFY